MRIGVRAEQVLRDLGSRAAGDEALEMAPSCTQASTLGTVELDHHVSELTRRAGGTPIETAAEDETAADAGTERQEDHVVRPAAGADRPLRDGSRVGVVVDCDGQAEILFAALPERHGGQRNVHREHGRAVTLVNGRRDSDPDRCHRVVPKSVDDFGQAPEKCLGGLDRSRTPLNAHDGSVTLHHPRQDLRAADVDTDRARG